MKFDSFALAPQLLESLQTIGYHNATPIQQQAIPPILKGRDVIGCAQTGTGKTAAFALPTLHRLITAKPEPTGSARRRQRSGRRAIRGLVVAPTRELSSQIATEFSTYGQRTALRTTAIFGGVRQGPQVEALRGGIDLLVATPGRLLDLLGQGFVDLSAVQILILDEADRMLDMGFIHDLRKIIARLPDRRQTLMFSATLPAPMRGCADQWLRRPLAVTATPSATTPSLVDQSAYFVERSGKAAALAWYLQSTGGGKSLVFSRTRRGADRIARRLQRDGIPAVAIHGNLSQARRNSVMRQFESPQPPILVATDLAARGLDFSHVSHVINYDMPDTAEAYIHRIGRTARAGSAGQAISLCSTEERGQLRLIEKGTGKRVPIRAVPTVTASTSTGLADEPNRREPRSGSRPVATGGPSCDILRHSSMGPSRAATAPAGTRSKPRVGHSTKRTSGPRRPRLAGR